MRLFETATDLKRHSQCVQRRRYGVIEAAQGQLACVRLRPFPKVVTLPEATLLGRLRHRAGRGDRCRLYYNQPWGHDNFLVLKYVESTSGTSLATFRRALTALDEIARIKRSDAIVADVSNLRISDRLLARWGWVPHCPSRWHRHFIKRFYGSYEPAKLPC
jgi:hypothetical protein